jgi:hypothetical protein
MKKCMTAAGSAALAARSTRFAPKRERSSESTLDGIGHRGGVLEVVVGCLAVARLPWWTAGRDRVDDRRKSRDVAHRRVYRQGSMTPEDQKVVRIIDGSQQSLARRVDLALSGLPDGSRVDHFTYWYTGRPPLHEATVSPPVDDQESAA